MAIYSSFWREVPTRARSRFEIANLSNGKRNARQNVQSPAIGANLMAGQPSAPEDHAATLLQAEPRSHDTVFMVRVQRRFRSWGLMVRSAKRVSNHEATTGSRVYPRSTLSMRKSAIADLWGLILRDGPSVLLRMRSCVQAATLSLPAT